MNDKQTRIAELVAQIDEAKAKIAEERDKLRQLGQELGDLLDSTNRGVEHLEAAIDALSEWL